MRKNRKDTLFENKNFHSFSLSSRTLYYSARSPAFGQIYEQYGGFASVSSSYHIFITGNFAFGGHRSLVLKLSGILLVFSTVHLDFFVPYSPLHFYIDYIVPE